MFNQVMRLGFAALMAVWAGAAASAELVVGAFSTGDLTPWQSNVFAGETRYALVRDGSRRVLQADSRGTASGLYREIAVDLRETPYLNWSWRVANVLQEVDEHSKEGDDFSARVYVIISGGALFWQTRSLVYVWSNNQAVGSTWKNPYTRNVWVMALRAGQTEVGQWVSEKRNIREDFRLLFGADIDHVDAVAVMTDTDNSHQAATAWYGDIYFSTH